MDNDLPQEHAVLQKAMLRPARSLNADGSFELGYGTFMLCLSLASYVYVVLPRNSLWTSALSVLMLLCGGLAPLLVPKAIKKYVSWPRTGYVAYPVHNKNRWVTIIVAVVIGFGVAFVMPRLMAPRTRQAVTQMLGERTVSGARPQRALLGIRMQPLTADLATAFKLPPERGGAVVEIVFPHSAAAEAGIKSGDVILEANGKQTKDPPTLGALIAQSFAGSKISLRVLRAEAGQPPVEKVITAVLGGLPPGPPASSGPRPASPYPMSPGGQIMLVVLLLLGGAALMLYWCRKVIRMLIPWLPSGDIAPWNGQKLLPRLIGPGRRWMAVVGLPLAMFGAQLLFCGVSFGLLYLCESLTHAGTVSLGRVGMLTIIAGCNPILYLMANGVSLGRYPWKWLVLVFMVLGPLGTTLILPGKGNMFASEDIRPVMLLDGLLWFVSGVATLVSYLRHTPLLVAEAP